jgi:hypothetical protein
MLRIMRQPGELHVDHAGHRLGGADVDAEGRRPDLLEQVCRIAVFATAAGDDAGGVLEEGVGLDAASPIGKPSPAARCDPASETANIRPLGTGAEECTGTFRTFNMLKYINSLKPCRAVPKPTSPPRFRPAGRYTKFCVG